MLPALESDTMFPFWVDAAGLWEQLVLTAVLCTVCLMQLWSSFRLA